MTIVVMLNNFLHDFSAAGWIFGTVLLWTMIRKKIPGGDAGATIIQVLKQVILLMGLSLAGVVIFGVFRALAYQKYEWNAAAGEAQVTLLIVKHIILAGVLVLGLHNCGRAKKMIKKRLKENIDE